STLHPRRAAPPPPGSSPASTCRRRSLLPGREFRPHRLRDALLSRPELRRRTSKSGAARRAAVGTRSERAQPETPPFENPVLQFVSFSVRQFEEPNGEAYELRN